MVHVAIMKKSWRLTGKILSGEKIIETRWYRNKSKPWDCIKAGEVIYFKDSGEPVTVKAKVSKVKQYRDLNKKKINELLAKYSEKDLGVTDIIQEVQKYVLGKKYAIIIHLEDPQQVKPFEIDKTGYGAMSAWLCVENINLIRIVL